MLSVPIEYFTDEQKNWYVRLVIAAVLADGQIKEAEIQYLKDGLQILPDGANKTQLLGRIKDNDPPRLEPPPASFAPFTLVNVILDVIEIIVSDVHLSANETDFLARLTEIMSIREETKEVIMAWSEEGIAWNGDKALLIHGEGFEGDTMEKVPLKELGEQQKYLYAKTLVICVLIDAEVEAFEQRYLKYAITLLKDKNDQLELVRYLKNKIAPPLEGLSGFSPEVLRVILIEVIMLLSGGNHFSASHQTFFEKLSILSGVDKEEALLFVQWHRKGLGWKSHKERIINRVQKKGFMTLEEYKVETET